MFENYSEYLLKKYSGYRANLENGRIGKLLQENFSQLNESVNKIFDWNTLIRVRIILEVARLEETKLLIIKMKQTEKKKNCIDLTVFETPKKKKYTYKVFLSRIKSTGNNRIDSILVFLFLFIFSFRPKSNSNRTLNVHPRELHSNTKIDSYNGSLHFFV